MINALDLVQIKSRPEAFTERRRLHVRHIWHVTNNTKDSRCELTNHCLCLRYVLDEDSLYFLETHLPISLRIHKQLLQLVDVNTVHVPAFHLFQFTQQLQMLLSLPF